MDVSILISILGAGSAILVSIIGAWLANRNSIILQTRKLKESHYENFIEALHSLMGSDNKDVIKKYVFARDKLFLIANEDVIRRMILFEEKGVGKSKEEHDNYLTELIKAIRKDLKIKDKDFPKIYMKKA